MFTTAYKVWVPEYQGDVAIKVCLHSNPFLDKRWAVNLHVVKFLPQHSRENDIIYFRGFCEN